MKKIVILMALMMLVNTGLFAENMSKEMPAKAGYKMPVQYQAVTSDKAVILQEGEGKMFCPRCGMTLPMFYRTNHAAHVHGKSEQYCSIHCLAETMANDANVSEIKVVDNKTLKFIDAKTAWYAVGSSKAGTMSMISKYGFAEKADAEAFAKEFGGKVMNFDDTLALVKGNLEKESMMLHKKQAMMAKKGEMMYTKLCKPITSEFKSVAEAKTFLAAQKPCGELMPKQMQAIGLYLKNRTK